MTHTRSINEIELYSANVLNALQQHRLSHAVSFLRQMVEGFKRDIVVNEIAMLLKLTGDRAILLRGIPNSHKFALLLESCNQKNDAVLEFILLSYPIKEMPPLEFSKFIAIMLNNGMENKLIRNFIQQRKKNEKLIAEMNQALYYTIKMSHRVFWSNPRTLENIGLLFEFGANLCSHVMDLLKDTKVIDNILYALVYEKRNINLSFVKRLMQAGANIFAKDLVFGSKTIYEHLQNNLLDIKWLAEEKYLDHAKPEQLAYLIEKNHAVVGKNKLSHILMEKRKDELQAFYQLRPDGLDKLLFNHLVNVIGNYSCAEEDVIVTTFIEWGANALRKYEGISALDIAMEQLRIPIIYLILQKRLSQISVSDQVKLYYLTYMEHSEIPALIAHPSNMVRETVFNKLKNPLVEQHFIKEMIKYAHSDYECILKLGMRAGMNERNLIFLLDLSIQQANHELASCIIMSDAKHLPQDKLLSAIHFLLDSKTENPQQFEHVKFLRLINDAQLTDEEKKEWVSPILLLQIHKAKDIPQLMKIVDLLKLNKRDFKYLESTPNIMNIAIKSIVSRMKEMAIIASKIILPDDISYQKILAFLKSVSRHSLYSKHDHELIALVKGKVIYDAKDVLVPTLKGVFL